MKWTFCFNLGIHLKEIAFVVLGNQRRWKCPPGKSCHALFPSARRWPVTLPCRVISPVMARSWRTGMPDKAEISARGQRDAGRGTVLGDCPFRRMDMDYPHFSRLSSVMPYSSLVNAGVADGELGALLHHIAQAAGDLNLPGTTGDDGNFHRQHFTAHSWSRPDR